ncbi:MAG: DUF1538 domain-containing protein [Planctomycetaceae bacterium]|nr:DUF1538 domain-containing protein [Planctomycetaceae bacterium]
MFEKLIDAKSWGRILSRELGPPLLGSVRDLLPIIATVVVFQLFVFQQPLANLGTLLLGLVFVVLGLSFFLVGLEMGLFPLGEQLARDLAKKGSVPWLLTFAFALGFGTTFAEPALIAIGDKAGELASLARADRLPNSTDLLDYQRTYSLVLRSVVAVSVGVSLVFGVLRIIRGWPIQYLIVCGYGMVMVLTPLAPHGIVGIAYDSGGVTTSTITVPLTAALGVGLANCIKGRNPLFDGFGLIAFASLLPIVFVLLMGILWP